MWFRCIGPIMLAATTIGCGQYGVSGPDDLGLVRAIRSRDHSGRSQPVRFPLSAEAQRNQELSKWIVRSDYQCNKYLAQLSRGIRDSRLATDAVGTILSGLATILAPVGTKTALSGAATITLGVGGDFQSDLFAQQAGEVLISAVQTVRTRARKDLQDKMQAPYETYTLEQGLVDIQRYDQETCNLNVGLNELRASLIVGPDVKRPNNPILPLPPGPPSSLLPPPPPTMPPVLPIAPPVPPASNKPVPGRPTTKPVGARPLNPGVALNAAIDRIKQGIKVENLVADQLEKCGLPKDNAAAAALTDTQKNNITKCLNGTPIITRTSPSGSEGEAKQQLISELNNLRSLPKEQKITLTEKCLKEAGFPDSTIVSDLMMDKLSQSQVPQVVKLAECLRKR